MLAAHLAVVGGLAVAVGLSSRLIRDLPVSEPLAALAVGVVFGPRVLHVVGVPADQTVDALATAAEIALALSLMSIALRFALDDVRAELGRVALLITVALVAMAIVPALLAAAVLGLALAPAALLGATLAPTDPILASNVVIGAPARRAIPKRLRVLLSVESGANDALAFALVAVAAAAAAGDGLTGAGATTALRLVIALPVGVGLGWAVGRLVLVSERHHDMEHSAFLVLTVSLTVLVLGLTQVLGGQPLVAVLAAGFAYNHHISQHERREEWEIQEAMNRYLVLPVFVLLGAALPWSAWADLGPPGIAFCAAVLVLRRLPVVLAMRPLLRLDVAPAVFLGWFGPIGVAALFYLADERRHGVVDDPLWAAGTLVIAASTLVHGLTGTVGRNALERRGSSRRSSRS